MTTYTITNIVLEKERFKVFVSYSNEQEEILIFEPDATSETIKEKIEERKSYFDSLLEKEELLKSELIK